MTKKHVSIILVIAIILMVMVMSLWGKKPEADTNVSVDALNFYKTDGTLVTEINSGQWKEKKIPVEYPKQSTQMMTYEFSVKLVNKDPEKIPTDTGMKWSISMGDKVTLDEIRKDETITIDAEGKEHHSNLYYFSVTFSQEASCRIKFISNLSGSNITDYLLFSWFGTKGGGDIPI